MMKMEPPEDFDEEMAPEPETEEPDQLPVNPANLLDRSLNLIKKEREDEEEEEISERNGSKKAMENGVPNEEPLALEVNSKSVKA